MSSQPALTQPTFCSRLRIGYSVPLGWPVARMISKPYRSTCGSSSSTASTCATFMVIRMRSLTRPTILDFLHSPHHPNGGSKYGSALPGDSALPLTSVVCLDQLERRCDVPSAGSADPDEEGDVPVVLP